MLLLGAMAIGITRTILDFGALAALTSILVCLIITRPFTHASQSDVDCLRAIKSSLEDPSNVLASSWNFNNSTEGFICRFTGIECWHENENKVLNIRLSDMGLRGEFPQGISGCESMTGLDLSRNNIYGNIPNNISRLIRFVTSLDLSYNQLSGVIPDDLASCYFLNSLRLEDNRLTGQIPLRIGQLDRLNVFSVANNRLSGQVPRFVNATFTAESYANNDGLCGETFLPHCSAPSRKGRTPTIIGAAAGGLSVVALVTGVALFFLRKSKKKKDDDPLGNKWARNIKGAKRIKLSMFENSVSKMSLIDLMKATNDFSNENIIGTRRSGSVYKAVLGDGTSLMVKRLQDTHHSEKEFISEMATLGSIKHNNLVPLLGFCVAKTERFLVYQYMPNGTLHDKLHAVNDGGEETMDWPLRLKIAVKAAKGFAWLHHSCNPRVIHRNISSKCILLDSNYEPKISDFGLARLMNPVDTHLSTFVNGEFGDLGYVAPEYARTLMATPKGDVYSFGVVLLELVTGEKPTHVAKAPESFKGNLAEWISQLGNLEEAIDQSFVGKGYDSEAFQFLKVACKCVVPAHKERPTMFEVYQLLRAVGQRYDFTTEDELLMPSDVGDAEGELIVARQM